MTDGNKLPFGNLPRLILAWLCTEAVRTQNRELVLGKSLADFMRAPGVYSTSGGKYTRLRNPIAAESVVDITGDLEITEDGALTVQTEMEPLGVLTISTHGRGELVSGSARVVSDGPIGGMLRFDHPDLGVAGVGASPPLSDALFPVRRQEGGITTGVALHNLESSPGPSALSPRVLARGLHLLTRSIAAQSSNPLVARPLIVRIRIAVKAEMMLYRINDLRFSEPEGRRG